MNVGLPSPFAHLIHVFGHKQVCTHGLVSFGSPITTTSGSVPRGYGPPLIAANWYSFRTYSNSTGNKGRVYYRSTTSGRPSTASNNTVNNNSNKFLQLAILNPSVRLTVTPWHCVKRTQVTIMGSSLEDSPMTLVSSTLDFTAKFQREHRERGRRMREG